MTQERPTGIIRTLPKLPALGERSISALENGAISAVYFSLSGVPRIEVLHLYLLIAGEISLRMNIAGYEHGDSRKCWDNTTRKPRCWAICTAPVSRAPEPIKRRGFQGFRYTGGLW